MGSVREKDGCGTSKSAGVRSAHGRIYRREAKINSP